MFRITLAVLALALVAAPFVVDAQTVALLSNQMTSPLVGTTAPLGAGKGIVSTHFLMPCCRAPLRAHTGAKPNSATDLLKCWMV